MTARTKKRKNNYFLISSGKNHFFENENIEEDSRFPTVLDWEEEVGTLILLPLFECQSRWHFCFSLISMHHNGFTKSFACCLSCESCLCAQCQKPGQGKGNVRMGRLWGGWAYPGLPSRSLNSRWLGFKLCPEYTLHPLPLPPNPTKGRVEPGKNNLLFEYLILKNIQ